MTDAREKAVLAAVKSFNNDWHGHLDRSAVERAVQRAIDAYERALSAAALQQREEG